MVVLPELCHFALKTVILLVFGRGKWAEEEGERTALYVICKFKIFNICFRICFIYILVFVWNKILKRFVKIFKSIETFYFVDHRNGVWNEIRTTDFTLQGLEIDSPPLALPVLSVLLCIESLGISYCLSESGNPWARGHRFHAWAGEGYLGYQNLKGRIWVLTLSCQLGPLHRRYSAAKERKFEVLKDWGGYLLPFYMFWF